ncbi:MAG: ATP-dependent Clp protease ATP-binding subunit, partial [Gemmatimonadaceae bacterium]|nr:ATP-dependent Clp protease ATP-binding subunit [Gloeobacterales cyanobacterium ES-bin-141]
PNALRRARSAPICVLLFDEVEKANRSLWPMLLAFFDEGRAGDSKGTVVAPQNTIVLMTSNLAAEAVGDEPERAKEILRRTGYFPQEFLGRVNKVIPLRRLAERDNERLIQRLLGRLGSDYGIRVKLDRSAMDALVEKTREEAWTYGGRGILEKLSDLLTDDLLDLQERGFKEATLSASRTSAGFVVKGSLGRARA